MGLFSFLFGRHKKNKVEEPGLELGMVGSEVTPISITPTAKAQEAIALTLPLEKLNNRLRLITNTIKKLEARGGPKAKIEHMKEREKTKALLWIYYDVETK